MLITGATGFVGRRVVRALCDRGAKVRCLVHTPGREGVLAGLDVECVRGSAGDVASLRPAMSGAGAVVHLVAVIREKGRSTFESVNVQGARNVALAAKEAGVRHIVHVSAIGARDDRRFAYLHSKWRGEQAVMQSGVPYTVIRPSLQFGEGDEFFNVLAALVMLMPAVPMPGMGQGRFQPIAVEDVARCVAQAVDSAALFGQVVEIGGPQRFTYKEMIGVVARTLGRRRAYLPVPVPLLRLQVWLMERVLPRPPITTKQLQSLPIDNVAELDTVERVFGFQPRPLAGNIDYVRNVSYGDALRIFLGAMPGSIRDH
ncbi:MAG: complex I NDUFA9 subunit family protein [Chloroflexota bacterium]|nr:complex I NDUFA9 subunit family protein [Chloroflexota bacterium]